MLIIQSDGNWILVVISLKYKQIMMCDSLDNNDLPLRCVEDTVSFLRYYYPEIPETDWRYDTLNAADRFQNAELKTDCGFHILNFMHAALKMQEYHYYMKPLMNLRHVLIEYCMT